MRIARNVFVLLGLLIVPLWARAQPQVIVSDVRLGQHGEHTRFVLNLSQKVELQTFSLADPYRIVVDFPEIDWRIDSQSMAKSRGLVSGYRYGLYKEGRSRLVIDLVRPALIANKFLLPPDGNQPFRLVLDFVPVDRAKYLTSAGWPKLDAARDGGAAAEFDEEDPAIAMPHAASGKGKRVVVIDAGHGGVDPGAIGSSGAFEKDVVLKLALELRDLFERENRYRVVMTRDTDIFLSLKARVAVARRERADLFISLHADAAPGSGARGASVYTLSEQASDREAEALAKAENQSDVISGVDLSKEGDIVSSILIDLAQRETKNNAVRFAGALIPELHNVGRVTHKSHRFAGFRVLKAPDVPSVLLEVGYITDPNDESAMKGAEWRRRMSAAISRSVATYFKSLRSAEGATGVRGGLEP